MDNLTAMKVFTKVVETDSFSAAATVLGISTSGVSKGVARLEDRLGARLLDRTTRRQHLTEVGSAYYKRCTRILADVEEAELAVSQLHGEPRGKLRVNGSLAFSSIHVAPAIPAFMERYPDIVVEIILNDRFIDLIEEGFDVAIRIANIADTSLVARRLAPNRRVVCAAPEYWRRHGRPALPRDLIRHNCLSYTYQVTPNDWPFRWGGRARSVPVVGNFATNNGDCLRETALSGLGVALIPTFLAGEDVRAGRLETVLQEYEETDTTIYAVYPHGRHLSAKVRAFVDFLAERFSPGPYWDDI